MRIVPKTFIKTTLLAFLSCLVLSGCSQFGHDSTVTASVSFSLNAARAAAGDGSETFVDVELQGDYKASKTVTLTADKIATVTFDNIPVGKSVNVAARIYTMYDDVKLVLYAGESEKKALVEGDNQFAVPMQIAYNSIAKGTSSCVILKPLFTSEATNTTLKTNKLDFTSESETFSFKVNTLIEDQPLVLDEYQKAIITIKGAAEGEHTIRTKFVKSPTAAIYYQDPVIISSETKPYELIIPQGIKLDSVGFENSWDDPSDSWASDYSFVIEKIELFKDSSLIDPEFNVVTKTASTYTVKNPAVQIIAASKIDKNSITFDSEHGYYDTRNGYSAAYWEFDELSQYDKVYVKLSRTSTGETGSNFIIRGYTPFDYSIHQESKTSIIPAPGTETTPKYYRSVTNSLDFTLDLTDLKTGLDKFSAISFQDNHGEANFGETWSMKIEEIRLEKTGSFNISVEPLEADIEVTDTDVNTGDIIGKKFTAPAGYTSYVWKVNGQVQEETGNEFTFNMKDLDNQVYDVILLADSETEHHSWQAHITKS